MNQMASRATQYTREKVNAVDRPFVPAASKNHGHHGDDLHQHLELAQFARLNRKTFGRGNRAQPAHQKFAADDDHSHPGRHQRGIELHQRDERGGDQQLVGQRIEQHAHGRDLAALTREIAVNAVSDRGQDENGRRQDFSFPGLLARETWCAKNPDEQRDRGNAGERDVVRKIHAMTEPRAVNVIILYIRGQGNGPKGVVPVSVGRSDADASTRRSENVR